MFDLLHQYIQSEGIIIFIISALPVIELRGALPLGLLAGIDPVMNYLICFIGSMLPVPFMFFLIRPILHFFARFERFQDRVNHLIEKTLKKGEGIRRLEFWGLLLFVAIPLPGTGVWTGTLAAVLLDLRFKTAFPAILMGNALAGVVVTMISLGVGSLG